MSLVTHKYTPAEMSERELDATFAARGHTVDYLLDSLRNQIHAKTLSSFVITGPRGAGKSTVIHMVALRIRRDPKLNGAWLPVVFPEEQFSVTSLRDFLAAILGELSTDGLPEAQAWQEKVAAEPNDEQSEQLAMTGLKAITKKAGKRLVIFVENLNHLLEDCLDDQMKGTLRRLLMVDPFMLLIGSAVHVFDSLKNYDEAFFNYFGPVPLDRLSAEQVFELLKLRAKFDGNEQFLRDFPKQQAKIRAIVQLSGGNPRLILMLYELLSQRQITTIVQCLRRLVDELTPLLKDEMESLPPQQRKIIHALMEKGGTAKPADLAAPTRLPLNAITSQLKRLKDAQFVELLGGGKGQKANYTAPDKLFSIWYQMRYLGQNRRRIELFVEVLRVWFEEEDRLQMLRKLEAPADSTAALVVRERATTAEYLAASLCGTIHQKIATDICIARWVETDLQEASCAYADLLFPKINGGPADDAITQIRFASWLNEHGSPEKAIKTLDPIIAKGGNKTVSHSTALQLRAVAKFGQGDFAGAISDCDSVFQQKRESDKLYWVSLTVRGYSKGRTGDFGGAIADLTNAIASGNLAKEALPLVFTSLAVAKHMQGDAAGALSDYSTVIELENSTKEQVAEALFYRGSVMCKQGDEAGGMIDIDTIIATPDAPRITIAKALLARGLTAFTHNDLSRADADLSTAVKLDALPKDLASMTFLSRGIVRFQKHDLISAIADFTSAIDYEGVSKEVAAQALFLRAVAFANMQDEPNALNDLLLALDLGVTANAVLNNSAELALRFAWVTGNFDQVRTILEKFSNATSKLPGDSAREESLRLLSSLASPEMKEGWPFVWRTLAENPTPEVTAALQFYKPVCDVLEGQDRALLDALPPEQREFAQSVLARFNDERAAAH